MAYPRSQLINEKEPGCEISYRAIGSAEALVQMAADLDQRWMKGVSGEFALKKLREQPQPW